MKHLNKNMHGDDPAFHRLPEDPNLAAQYLLLYELSLPFGSDLNDRIDVAKSATRMVVVTRNAGSRKIRELDARAQEWLDANIPEFAHEASGLSVVFAHLSLRNINSMLRGTIVAMALSSFILIWIFKSVRIGLLSLLPNFIPAVMSFGLWGYLVGHVGIASSVVIAVVFGIVVDDTVHFLSNYLKGSLGNCYGSAFLVFRLSRYCRKTRSKVPLYKAQRRARMALLFSLYHQAPDRFRRT